jgi:hypothetical protein
MKYSRYEYGVRSGLVHGSKKELQELKINGLDSEVAEILEFIGHRLKNSYIF